MCKRIGDREASRLLLQLVVANGICATQRFFDIARVEEVEPLLGVMGPNTGEKISLQLESHRQAVSLLATCALAGSGYLVGDTEQLLHVMADLVRDYVRLRKITRRAEARLQLAVEAEIEINALIFRAIKRSDGRARHTACGINGAAEKDELRIAVLLAALAK